MLNYASRPRQSDEGNESRKLWFIGRNADIIMYISGYEQWMKNPPFLKKVTKIPPISSLHNCRTNILLVWVTNFVITV